MLTVFPEVAPTDLQLFAVCLEQHLLLGRQLRVLRLQLDDVVLTDGHVLLHQGVGRLQRLQLLLKVRHSRTERVGVPYNLSSYNHVYLQKFQ